MSGDIAEIYAAAMALPADERTELTRKLVESVGDSLELLYIDEWSDEVERRLDAYHRGDMPERTLEEVDASIRLALRGE